MNTFLTTLIILLSTILIPTPKQVTVLGDHTSRINGVKEVVDTTLQLPEEGYILETSGRKAVLKARSRQGLIYARATLAQLAGLEPSEMMNDDAFKKVTVPCVNIQDWPSFPIRGFMHDTGRNFREVETLKKELDLFAFYKINVFHWHLTDNPAWRIECRAYPQLNDPQYQREGRDEGRFYTYDQIRKVIAYARERGIMVIPEIDMPGHSQYFNKTFGFGMATPQGMEVLEACLKEFMQEIPAEDCPYIHIGSDEVKVADPKGFMTFCEEIVKAGGRTPIAWFPGLPSAEGTISQIWTEKASKVIGTELQGGYLDSYMGYLNLSCPLLNTANFYLHQLCAVNEYNGKALGGTLCLWNDVRVVDKSKTFPHNGMPEGLLSFAESSWIGGPQRSWTDYIEFEKKLIHHRDVHLKEWPMRWAANGHIPWQITVSDSNENTIIEETGIYGGCVDLNKFCKDNGVTPGKERIEAYLTTNIYVDKDTVITAWIGFDSPARSNRKSDGIGEQGKWEFSARAFVGETEIFPAKPWNEPGKYRYHHNTWNRDPNELPYTDEQFFWTREPAQIPLKAGNNTIKLYCPRVFDANVWIAAFVPITTDSDGSISEAHGIRYE